jgi:Ferritin-like
VDILPAVAEAPIVIGNRKELTYLLSEAAELEHALMCEYLFAAFSLRSTAGPGVSAAQLEAVERWRRVLLDVAAQEMLHWALVNNILTAVGSAPYVSRPHLPHQAKGYPAGVQVALVPFSARALRHFLFLERPEGMELDDAEGFEPSGPALPIMSERDIVPWGQEFSTVGHLYRSIEVGLARLAEKHGEDGLFIGPPAAQATTLWPDLLAIVDLESAHRAIALVVEQGEGARGDWSQAHYGRFLAVLEEYQALREADPGFGPAHPVVAAGVRPVEGIEPEVYITDPATAAVSDLFNAVYDLILQMIVRYFAASEETEEQRGALEYCFVVLMVVVIKPLGLLLATLPVGSEHPGATAGANFQLAYRGNFLLPHRRVAFIRFRERLDEAADFADGIDLGPAGAADARAVLDAAAGTLRSLSAGISGHIESP